jgi:hypothetical protein
MGYFGVFLAFVIAMIAVVTAETAHDREHAVAQQNLMRYMEPADVLARQTVQAAIATQVEANPGAQITTVTLSTSSTPVCGTGVPATVYCPSYIASASVVGGTSASGGLGTASEQCTNANDIATLDETCVSLVLTVKLSDSHGAPIGTRNEKLTYRTIDVPPYAILSGSNELSGGVAVGEANIEGCNPSATVTCLATTPPSSTTDTRFHTYNTCTPTFTECINPATGLPYTPQETSTFRTPTYNSSNQTAGSWNP